MLTVTYQVEYQFAVVTQDSMVMVNSVLTSMSAVKLIDYKDRFVMSMQHAPIVLDHINAIARLALKVTAKRYALFQMSACSENTPVTKIVFALTQKTTMNVIACLVLAAMAFFVPISTNVPQTLMHVTSMPNALTIQGRTVVFVARDITAMDKYV